MVIATNFPEEYSSFKELLWPMEGVGIEEVLRLQRKLRRLKNRNVVKFCNHFDIEGSSVN